MSVPLPPSQDDAKSARRIPGSRSLPGRIISADRCSPFGCSTTFKATLRKVIRDRLRLESFFDSGLYGVGDPNTTDLLVLSSSLDSGAYGLIVRRAHDAVSLSAAFDGGFMNPLRQHTRDTMALRHSFVDSVYTLTSISPGSLEDRAALNHSLESGTYLSVVVSEALPEDRMTLSHTLESGTATLVVVPATLPEGSGNYLDRIAMTVEFVDGAYTQTIFGTPPEQTERITLTNGFDSGIYG